MPSKSQSDVKKNEPKEIKSILVASSRVISRHDHLEGGEETEIAVQISVPREGGWGWVVVAAAFMNIFTLDGIVFTFGSIMTDVAEDFDIRDSLASLVNSIAVSMYYASGPIVGACINRYGFRACVLAGSAIASFSLFISYFVVNFGTLCLFYGVTAGFGYCLINMSSSLVVGFYFERLRPVALAIAASGSSMGIMVQYPINTYLANLAGWRSTTLFHAGLLVIIFFLGMTFKPLLSVTIRAAVDETQATRTVTYLPSLATVSSRTPSTRIKAVETLQPTTTERLLNAVSNANFPTAATVIKEEGGGGIIEMFSTAGPSSAASKLIVSAREPAGGFSKAQINQIKSIMSKSAVSERIDIVATQTPILKQKKKSGFFRRIFHWDEQAPEDRPLYRDDVFYEGNVERLPTYQKSTMGIPKENLTGLEYRLAVSRAATTKDLAEHRGFCTTAVRRVLATMLDPTLLRKSSFILMSCNGLLFFVGMLVPYVYLPKRNREQGIATIHCDLFVSVIGFSNTVGRLILGYLSNKINPIKLFQCTCMMAGLSTIFSPISYSLYFQYLYCIIFGFCISCITSLRSSVIVTLYGLEKLTNATGILLLFQGVGSLFSTPLAGVLKDSLGYPVAFIVAGLFMLLAGIIVSPVNALIVKENAKDFSVITSNVPAENKKTVAIKSSLASN